MGSLRPFVIGVSLSVLGGTLLLAASPRPASAQAAAPGVVGSSGEAAAVAIVVPPAPPPLLSDPIAPAVRVVDVREGLEIPVLHRYEYPFPAEQPRRDRRCGARASGPAADGGRVSAWPAVLS